MSLSPDAIRRVFEHLRDRDLEVCPTLVSPAAYDALDLWFRGGLRPPARPHGCSVCRARSEP